MRHGQGPWRALIVLAGAVPLGGAVAPMADVSASVTGLRSDKGQVLACLTADPDTFPGCDDDPAARTLTVPADRAITLRFTNVPRGRYAIALIHDENDNGKLDKRLVVPREGFGFSRNAPVAFGPPRFEAAAFDVSGRDAYQAIRMRYMF